MKDGIKSNEDSDEEKGFIWIDGGFGGDIGSERGEPPKDGARKPGGGM